MRDRIDLGGGKGNSMLLTKKGVISVYKYMIKLAKENIGRITIYNVLITEDFIKRLEDRLFMLTMQISLSNGRWINKNSKDWEAYLKDMRENPEPEDWNNR